LRPLTSDDLAATHALWTDPGVRKYLWDDVVIGEDQAAEVIAASERHFQQYGYGLWAVSERTNEGPGLLEVPDHPLMGVCGFRPSEAEEPELLFGFWPRYWKQGLANESACALIAYVFDILQCPSVVAATDVPNDSSILALRRLGMTLERRGVLNGLDTLFFRLSREQFTTAFTAR
jgi:[ribosomal protein S5]-alanine N-acetyltransferase